MNVELREDVLDVLPNGFAADDELSGDLRPRATGNEQAQDLILAPRQPGLMGGSGSSKQPTDRRKQAVGNERLCKVVVCADEQPGSPIELSRPFAGGEDDRELLAEVVAELPADLVPRCAGERDFDEDKLWALPPHERTRARRGIRFARCEPGAVQRRGCESAALWVVVDDQDWP